MDLLNRGHTEKLRLSRQPECRWSEGVYVPRCYTFRILWDPPLGWVSYMPSRGPAVSSICSIAIAGIKAGVAKETAIK